MQPLPTWSGRRRRHAQRVLRVVAATLLIALGLSAEGLHGLFQPHRFCAAHGVLEHAGPEHAETAGHDHLHQGERPSTEPRLATDAASGEHELCCLSTYTRDRGLTLPAAPASSITIEYARVPAPLPIDVPRPVAIATYRLAPKQSPPAA